MIVVSEAMITSTVRFTSYGELVSTKPIEYDKFRPDDVDCEYCQSNPATELIMAWFEPHLFCHDCATLTLEDVEREKK